VENRLKNHGIVPEIFLTEHHGHAMELLKDLPVKKYDGIVAAGGDGTNYQVLNGLLNITGMTIFRPLG